MQNIFKTKTLIIALIVGFFGLTFGQNLFAQGSGERTVNITITESSNGGEPTYTVNPEDLIIPEKKSRVPITFILSSDNYEFMGGTNHGFNITPVDDNFKINGLSHRKKQLHLIDFNKDKLDYYYTITVINPETKETLLIDPRIKNGGGGTT